MSNYKFFLQMGDIIILKSLYFPIFFNSFYYLVAYFHYYSSVSSKSTNHPYPALIPISAPPTSPNDDEVALPILRRAASTTPIAPNFLHLPINIPTTAIIEHNTPIKDIIKTIFFDKIQSLL